VEGRKRVRAFVGGLVGAAVLSAAVAAPGASAATPCPGTFKVLHNDRIGPLQIPQGNYVIKVKRMTCQNASNNFTNFLQLPQGNLPNGWKVIPAKKKFVNRGLGNAFKIRPAA
jgi:hypothetical protein